MEKKAYVEPEMTLVEVLEKDVLDVSGANFGGSDASKWFDKV